MAYPPGDVERAMKVQEVILRALSRQLTWIQAAEILGCSARSIRRLRLRYQQGGYDGLLDHRRQTPSPKRAPVAGGAADRRHLTQVGRALAQLGIEHILGYSPQARGRSERMNGTWQGRLVNELRGGGDRDRRRRQSLYPRPVPGGLQRRVRPAPR